MTLLGDAFRFAFHLSFSRFCVAARTTAQFAIVQPFVDMKKVIASLAFLLVFFSASAAEELAVHSLALSGSEKEYLAKRNQYVRALSAENLKNKDSGVPWLKVEAALKDLETDLRGVVQSKNVVGFERRAKINLETLVEGELGFGLMDGLRYKGTDGGEHDSSTLVVTSTGLLSSYLLSDKRLPRTIEAALRNEYFVSSGLYPDASADFLGEIPVRLRRSKGLAVAFLALAGQDIGYQLPNALYIGVVIEKTVIVVMKNLPKAFPDIKRCRGIADYYTQKYESVRTDPRRSGPMPEAAIHLDWQGQREYSACVKSDAAKLPEYVSLSKLAQEIVEAVELSRP